MPPLSNTGHMTNWMPKIATIICLKFTKLQVDIPLLFRDWSSRPCRQTPGRRRGWCWPSMTVSSLSQWYHWSLVWRVDRGMWTAPGYGGRSPRGWLELQQHQQWYITKLANLKKYIYFRENVHQVGSILFVKKFIIPQLAIWLTSTFLASSDHWTFSFWRRPPTAVETSK